MGVRMIVSLHLVLQVANLLLQLLYLLFQLLDTLIGIHVLVIKRLVGHRSLPEPIILNWS